MKTTRIAFCISAILILILFSVCQRTTSPYLNNYDGDYSLDAAWVVPSDTFFVLDPYLLDYASTGKDFFLSFRAETSPGGEIDTAFFRKALTTTQMSIMFLLPFTGNVIIKGIQPNYRETDFSLPVTVVNPFKITGTREVFSGQSITLSIAATQNTAHTARWFLDNELVDTKIAGSTFSITRDTAVSYSVFALISDTLGNTVLTDTISATFKPRVPAAKFLVDSIQIPVGQETTITIQATDCDSIRWVSVAAGLDTTTTGNLKTTFAAAGNFAIIATGISRFGITGTADTLHATALHFNYALKLVQFPDTIRTRRWAQWEVQATRNGSAVSGANVVYEWNITLDSLWDSLKTSSDGRQLSLFVNDSLAPFSHGVRAKIGATDSTAIQNLIVVVRTYRPGCTFVSGEFAGQINQPIPLTLKAKDSNTDGAIAGIYFSTSDNPTMVTTAGAETFSVTFSTPHTQKVVRAIAVDNDGFVSDTAVLYGTITANKPYFVRPTIDTTIFIHAAVSIIAQAHAGNTGDSIVAYQWDMNNDGVWDLTSAKNRFDTTFTEAGVREIKVSCKNQRGDSTATYMTVKITVLDGAPTVRNVLGDPMLSYIGVPIAIKITAADTNGMVKAVAIKVNGGADTVFAVRAAASIDTAIKLTFDSPGKYHIAVAAIDNHGRKSGYRAVEDSLIVSSGNPIVKAIKPDSAWIYDTITYTISASDVNGTVKSWFIAWDGSGSFVQYADSTAKYRYTTAETKQLKGYVIDNDNLSSDTLIDSVMVKLGKPTALQVFPDSVYIYKNIQYKVRGTDPNGTVRQWGISWESGQPFEIRNDSNFTHTFTSDGLKAARCYVADDDGISSDTIAASVYVKLGLPEITAITTSPALSAIYIRDTIAYKIKAHDENGAVDSVFASWNGDTLFESKAKAVGDSALFTYAFARAESGAREVRFRVKDVDGLVRDSVIAVFVKAGAPVIDSISPDTVWIRDSVQYRLFAHDENGYIDSFRVSFDMGVTWKAADSANFKHAWDTSKSGMQKVIARVMDDDSVWTADTFDILVRLGRPILSLRNFGSGTGIDSLQIKPGQNGALDTLFYVYKGGNTSMAVDTADSNGECVRFYWDTDNNGQHNVDNDSPFLTYNFGRLESEISVWCKDDDSIQSEKLTFYLYPDEPPPAPSFNVWYSGTGNIVEVRLDTTTFDVKDRHNTEVLIKAGPKNPTFTVRDTLLAWLEAATLVASGNKRIFAFDKSAYETEYGSVIYLRVSYRDKRGSVTVQPTTFTY